LCGALSQDASISAYQGCADAGAISRKGGTFGFVTGDFGTTNGHEYTRIFEQPLALDYLCEFVVLEGTGSPW
jgi:hypothetical protein